MKHRGQKNRNEDENTKSESQTLDVLLVYDEVNAAKALKESCDRIGQSLGPGWNLNLSVWKSTMLRFPEISHVATAAAEHAIAIVFAIHSHEDLPSETKAWIEGVTGRERRGADCILVALLQTSVRFAMETAPAFVSLSQLARNSGMDFFCDIIEPKQDESDYSVEGVQRRAASHTAILDAILHHN
jgi:hypothetical protein